MTKLALDTETDGFTATVEHDLHGADESPREWAMESVFFGFHRAFASPDHAPDSDPETARDIATANDNICLPVWLYAHGGTCYRAAEQNPFHCPLARRLVCAVRVVFYRRGESVGLSVKCKFCHWFNPHCVVFWLVSSVVR